MKIPSDWCLSPRAPAASRSRAVCASVSTTSTHSRALVFSNIRAPSYSRAPVPPHYVVHALTHAHLLPRARIATCPRATLKLRQSPCTRNSDASSRCILAASQGVLRNSHLEFPMHLQMHPGMHPGMHPRMHPEVHPDVLYKPHKAQFQRCIRRCIRGCTLSFYSVHMYHRILHLLIHYFKIVGCILMVH